MTSETIQTLWDAYYYVLASRKGYEASTLAILREGIQGITLPQQIKASQKFHVEQFKGKQVE
jgi:hypothetical protein